MSYRIDYDSEVGKYEVKRDLDVFPWMFASLAILLLISFCFWPEGTTKLKEFLIPGKDAVTVQAFSVMTDDLRSGSSISEAVEAFCKAVIHGS